MDAPSHQSETVEHAPPDVARVRPGEDLDWPSLDDYLRQHIRGLDGEFEVFQFPHGGANLTYLVQYGPRRLVVRRPPFGMIAPGAHNMRREHHALSRLWTGYPKAPRAYVFCDDRAVVGSDFLVMEYRSGEVIRGAIPDSMEHHSQVGHRVGLATIDALAMLHSIEPKEVGLEDLGRPEGFLERQLEGWTKRWELAAPPDAEPLMQSIGTRLRQTLPSPLRVSILHNDYKLDNCQFDPKDPDCVKSVFDWDMATLGDPLVDLGTLLNYWPDPSDTDDDRPLYHPGMEKFGLPTRREAIDRYALSTGLDLAEVQWYEAFAAWKTAIVLQQLFTRYVRGETTDERMAQRADSIGPQARRAASILDSAGL